MAEPVLAAHNQLVYEAVIYALAEEPHKRRAKGDMIFADFGATQWCVQYLETAEIPDTLRVSVKVPALKGQAGVEEVLTEKYADIMVPAAEGFDASLEFNIDAHADSAAEELAMRVALLASVVSGTTLYSHFRKLEAAGPKGQMEASAPVKVMTRPDECYWVINAADKIIVAYSLAFLDQESMVVAKLMLQGFVNTAKYAGSAPSVAYSDTAPAEIADQEAQIGWSVATYFVQNVIGNKIDKAVQQAHNWRNVLSFHIKAAKQFTTSKMRHRVEHFQKVLDRAVPKKDQGKSVKASLTAIGVAGKLLNMTRAKGARSEQ